MLHFNQHFFISCWQGKLVKLFSKQLVAKAKIPADELPNEVRNIPSLKQWLQVVGISQPSVEPLCIKFASLEALQELSDHEIRKSFTDCSAKEDEYRRLARALQNVRRYTGIKYFKNNHSLFFLSFSHLPEVLVQADKEGNTGRTTPELTLYWDSWDSVTKTPSPSSTIHPNESSLHSSSPKHISSSIQNFSSQSSMSDNRTPPSTPSILKGRGKAIDSFNQWL